MTLSDRQIERYSRQIIVPGIGGVGQERLLAATVALIGEPDDLEAPLAYLVGAGVGTIMVTFAGGAPIDSRVVDDLRALNPDSRVVPGDPARQSLLALALIGTDASLEAARRTIDAQAGRLVIIARLDLPPRIAALAIAPCPTCADANLFGTFGQRAEQAEFVAMLATAEAIRILARDEPVAPRLIEFDGDQSRSIAIARRAGVDRCRCEMAGRADA